MKLLRYGEAGVEKPGLLDPDGRIRDLSGEVPDISGPNLMPDALRRLASLDPASLPLVEGSPRAGPCIGGVRNFLCVGLNYHDHAAEVKAEIPAEPILFMKANSAVSGPCDDVMLPRDSTRTDWEVELGVVLGSRCRYVTEDQALDHVAGYCIVNDVSERNFQIKRGGQWVKGKSCETFGPIGPWLVTREEVPDPQRLEMFLDVNGERMQSSTTANMIFGVAAVVSYISQFMVLGPGDIIATGTPAGVGLGRTPKVFLKEGDEMRLGVAGLGEQRQTVVAFRP